jgi:hypothetical protein
MATNTYNPYTGLPDQVGGGGGTPGGSPGALQYNNAGAFGGFGSYVGTFLNLGATTASLASGAVLLGGAASSGSDFAQIFDNGGADKGFFANEDGGGYSQLTPGGLFTTGSATASSIISQLIYDPTEIIFDTPLVRGVSDLWQIYDVGTAKFLNGKVFVGAGAGTDSGIAIFNVSNTNALVLGTFSSGDGPFYVDASDAMGFVNSSNTFLSGILASGELFAGSGAFYIAPDGSITTSGANNYFSGTNTFGPSYFGNWVIDGSDVIFDDTGRIEVGATGLAVLVNSDSSGANLGPLSDQLGYLSLGIGPAIAMEGAFGTAKFANNATSIDAKGGISLASLSNATANNNTLFYSTTGSKPAWKNGAGVTNYLY